MYSYYNPKPAVNAEFEMPIKDALKMYGLGNQGIHGDQTAPKPQFWEIRELYMWNAWDAEKGKSKEQAQREFLQFAYTDLKKRGIPPDPDYQEIEYNKKYVKCLEDEGKTRA